MIIATLLCASLGVMGYIPAWAGLGMLALLGAFLCWSYVRDRNDRNEATELHEREAEDLPDAPKSLSINIIYVVVGLVGLTGGAALLIDGATGIARGFGVPESIIGLTMIARHFFAGIVRNRDCGLTQTWRCRRWQCYWEQSLQYLGYVRCHRGDPAAFGRQRYRIHRYLGHARCNDRGLSIDVDRMENLPN